MTKLAFYFGERDTFLISRTFFAPFAVFASFAVPLDLRPSPCYHSIVPPSNPAFVETT